MFQILTLVLVSLGFGSTPSWAYQEQIYFGKTRANSVARDKCLSAMIWYAEKMNSHELVKLSSAYGEVGLGQYSYFCADFADAVRCDCSHKLFSGIEGPSCKQVTDPDDTCLDRINTELRRADLPPIGANVKKKRNSR